MAIKLFELKKATKLITGIQVYNYMIEKKKHNN